MLPAGFFLGLAEAWAWTAMPIITTFFAKRKASADPDNKEKHTRYYTGYYYGVIQFSSVSKVSQLKLQTAAQYRTLTVQTIGVTLVMIATYY